MTGVVVIIIIGLVVGFVGLYFALRQLLSQKSQEREIETLVEQVFGKSVNLVTQQSREVLRGEKDIIASHLSHQHKTLETMVETMRADLEKRQAEIRNLEQDRVRKFGELASSLESHRKLADELAVSTKRLAEVLSNNQARGEWGERIIEDLLQANGLLEGVHYERQTFLAGTNLKPDITLLLPDKRKVAVDVKFPYSEIQKLSLSETKVQQQAHLQQFSRDLKSKIEKVALYIDPGAQTLDYSIMFVPNEMVFSFINQKLPELIEYALSKRVLLVSPFTFLIVARTVMESYRNFMISGSLREAITQVDEFVVEWQKFKDQFGKYGRSLQTLQSDYENLMGTRVRQMERKIEKVQGYQKGSLLSKSSQPTLLDESDV